jgi:signal transduction histidine kinase/CheY-like chemotaxis protein
VRQRTDPAALPSYHLRLRSNANKWSALGAPSGSSLPGAANVESEHPGPGAESHPSSLGMNDDTPPVANDFPAEVRSRFGMLPSFFSTAASVPALSEQLWGFAKSAYLDSPLPSLFKERLFVQLSRFCEVRYCIVRHVGFLVGEGRPAGDDTVRPQSITQVIALLSRPVPDGGQLENSLVLLESVTSSAAIPKPESELEGALFDVLTILFVSPRGAERPRHAIAHAVGEPTFEILTAFLAFVRTAHYWTETHPTLAYESDVLVLMQNHPVLAHLMLDSSEAEWARSGGALRQALEDLRSTSGALRSSEERFRALVTATSDMLYRMSPDWTQMRALDGKGFLPDTTLPDRNWMRRYLPENEHAKVSAAIRSAVQTKKVFELEHQVLRIDGTVGCVLSRAVPILNGNNELVEWFGAALNLTARKNAEDALRDADRRKDEFLATLAHELRNPLAPLRNGLQVARLSSPADAPIRPIIEMMERQVNMLVHLVEDLMDVSRITTGKIELRLQRLNLCEVLAASAEASRATIDARGHKLVIELSAEELSLEGDFDRLTQVFCNLLSNAAKYTDVGGTIELRAAQEGPDAVVSVIDTGIGIPAADLPGVFAMFSQVRTHREHANGGLGIGLSLVRQLVEMHGGSVQVMSPGEGFGSTFCVRLPLTEPIAAITPEQTPGATETPPASRRRILVVDDNEDAATSLAALLEHLGHEVVTASDGEDAITKAAAFYPHVIFLDLGMPRMDGVEAAKRLRTLPHGEQTILIALTGWGQEHDLQRTQSAGFDHHLLKPIELDSLGHLF